MADNWCTYPMIINKNNPSVDYSLWLKRLATQLIKLTIYNSIKVSNVVKPTNKKTLS